MKTRTEPFKKTARRTTTNLHTIVKDSQLSFSDFGHAVGISRKTVKRIQDAHRFKRPYNPTMRTLLKISQATGTTLDDIVNDKIIVQ